DSTINAWHTCPAGGRINASNPCSEYMFLDDTACNLASINLLKFYDPESRTFDLEGYEHAISLWTVVLEISVLMASFPSKEIAELSWKYRTLGLGYANLGAMLMQAGIPYDSEAGRAVCAALTAILTGRSYAASAVLAAEHGPFDGYKANKENMLRVIRNHRRAAHGEARDGGTYEALRISPVPIDHGVFRSGQVNIANASDMLGRATAAWDDALAFGRKHGFRNAQVTVIAPTGTIGLLMDCDTTGVEPDFALTKFKKLAGGGYFKIANQSLRPALVALGYSAAQVDDIVTHVMGTLSLDVPMPAEDGTFPSHGPSLRDHLIECGYTGDEVVAIENGLPTVFEISFAFSAWKMPERLMASLGIDVAKARADMKFNGLRALGMSRKQIEALNVRICGTQTVEGAPHLKERHLAVFDCANRCGTLGQRF
ncbi:MAG: vitamin B12-dependent ribonucleotide reductase, partial [Phycisphaerales bacterium]